MRLVTISKTPAVEASPDYSDGDVIGGKLTLAGAVTALGNGGAIVAAAVYSKVDIGASIPIRGIVFNADPTASTFTENSAPTIHADDLSKIVGVIDMSQRLDLGTPVALFAAAPRIPFRCDGPLYVVPIAGGTINLGSTSDLTFVFGIERE